MIRASPETERALGLCHLFRRGESASEPLCLFVHGRAGNVQVMSTFRRCLPDSWNILSVQAVVPDDGGFSWWSVDEPSRERRVADIHAAVDLVSTFIGRALEYYALSPRCVIAGGFSQGAALLSSLAQLRPQLFAGVALLAGFVIHEMPAAGRLPRFFVGHGTQDTVVPVAKADEGVGFLRELGADVVYVQDRVGHKVGVSAMQALKLWTAGF